MRRDFRSVATMLEKQHKQEIERMAKRGQADGGKQRSS